MLDVDRLTDYLDVSPKCVTKLRRHLCSPISSSTVAVKDRKRIDYKELASQYFELISSGVCRNKADVARRIGKSRVWVSKVMNDPRSIKKR